MFCSYFYVMKLIEKDFLVGGARCGATLHYEEVEQELQVTPETPKLTRVLPSSFFYEKRLFFYLIKRYEPGEKKTFPQGGFEVRDEGGALRSYNLDQIIIHPAVIKHKKTLEKMARKAEKEQRKRARRAKTTDQPEKPKHGRRGRPAMDPALKAAKEADKAAKAVVSGGRRGRPKGTATVVKKEYVPTGGKRGRKPLSPEARAQREAAQAKTRAISGGKRGRPKRK
jgi:hypothetical protein